MRREPARPAFRDHLGVGVDAGRRDAAFAQEIEKLAAAAAQIEHVRRAGKAIDVVRLTPADVGRRPTKEILESNVAGAHCAVFAGHRRGCRSGRRPAFELAARRHGSAMRGGCRHPDLVERRFEHARLRVDVRRDLLQILHEDRIERHERFEFGLPRRLRIRQCGRKTLHRSGYLLEVRGHERVDFLLAREHRGYEAPHESREAPAQPRSVGRTRREDADPVANRGDVQIDGDGCRLPVGETGQGAIDVGQRVVVLPVGRIALRDATVHFAAAHALIG